MLPSQAIFPRSLYAYVDFDSSLDVDADVDADVGIADTARSRGRPGASALRAVTDEDRWFDASDSD